MKIAIVLGTRPEIIKLTSVIRTLESRGADFFVIHTGQHYSAQMDQVFFEQLQLPPARYNLHIKAATHGQMCGAGLPAIEAILLDERPDWVIVQGDTNTVLSGALAASKLPGLKIAHVEAGLRSYDRTMPEEINRVVVDHVSDLLLAPTAHQAEILRREGIVSEQIVITGNTVVDAVYQNQALIPAELTRQLASEAYFLLTCHRPSNADSPENLRQIITSVNELADRYHVAIKWPVHPRTRQHLTDFGLAVGTAVEMLEPVGYLQMLALEKNARLILTDSGGVQEEACILRVPCVTLRDNTERPETLEVGAAVLAGADPERIKAGAAAMLAQPPTWDNPFGDGHAGERVVAAIENYA